MLFSGQMMSAASDELFAEPLHPYTKALLSAIPASEPSLRGAKERILLGGNWQIGFESTQLHSVPAVLRRWSALSKNHSGRK